MLSIVHGCDHVLGKLRQEDGEFLVNQTYIVALCLKKQNKTKTLKNTAASAVCLWLNKTSFSTSVLCLSFLEHLLPRVYPHKHSLSFQGCYLTSRFSSPWTFCLLPSTSKQGFALFVSEKGSQLAHEVCIPDN
jgi:hypothetical protein